MISSSLLERNHHEHSPVAVFAGSLAAARAVAQEIAALVRARNREGRACVLGLATGSTPVSLYAELVRLHREEGLSFANVTTFNLDEYYPLGAEQPQSYRHFMRTHLFDRVDIDPARTHLPSGTVTKSEVDGHCAAYEEAIRAAGGIDLQLLGIGRTGHIGFNEPGSPRHSLTRLVTLDPLTRRDAAAAELCACTSICSTSRPTQCASASRRRCCNCPSTSSAKPVSSRAISSHASAARPS